jgi:hypothetical protein
MDVTTPGPEEREEWPPRSRFVAQAGVVLLVLSVVLWLPLPILPFLPIDGADQLAIAGGLVISAEVAFWTGAALAGPEAARRIRSWWRRSDRGPKAD